LQDSVAVLESFHGSGYEITSVLLCYNMYPDILFLFVVIAHYWRTLACYLTPYSNYIAVSSCDRLTENDQLRSVLKEVVIDVVLYVSKLHTEEQRIS